MPNMTHPAATTEEDWNNMKDAEEWDALRDEIDYHKADARKWANALDRANAELAKAAIQIADLCEEKEYAIRMSNMWRTDSEKLEALTIQLVKAQQQNNQRDWVAVIDALCKYGEAAREWNEGDAPIVGADSTAEPNCDRSQCGDFSPGPCDHSDCPAIGTAPDDMIAMENAQGKKFALKFNPAHPQHGWIFYDNHGQWVTLRRALPHEIERARGILEMREVLAGVPCRA